jgi:hypothetical protein
VRWHRSVAQGAHTHWTHYGWFTAMSCLCSLAGAAAYSARIPHLYFLFSSRKIETDELIHSSDSVKQLQMNRLLNELREQELRFCGVHYMIFPLELAFGVFAQLLVIRRMQRFALHNSTWQSAFAIAFRLSLATVVLSNVIGVGGNLAAAA